MLELCLACWMDLLGVTLLSVLFGSGLGYFAGIFLLLAYGCLGSIAFWRWLVRVALGMVLSIFYLLVLLRLAFSGILMPWLGRVLVCLCLVIWQVLFSISKLLFLMLGVTRLQLIFVGGKVLVVGLFWTSIVLCSSLILHVRER